MGERYDQQAKLLLEDEPRLVLEFLGELPRDEPAVIHPVDRELVMGVKRVDHAYRITRDDEQWIEHYEATTSFRHADLPAVFQRTTLLGIRYAIGVKTRIILMTDQSLPKALPVHHVEDDACGNTRIHHVRWICVWRMPAREALAMAWPALWPWVVLMDATDEEMNQALERLRGDAELLARAAVLYSLRYGKEKALWRFRMNSFLTDEIMKESPLVQDWVTQGLLKGRLEGRVEGRVEGRAEATRGILLSLLAEEYGEVPEWASARLQEARMEQVETWIRRVKHAKTIQDCLE